MQIFDEFAKIAKTYPAKPAIFFKEENQNKTLSYKELYNQAIKLGNLLYSKGIREQDKVAILLGNQPEWPISFMAIQYIAAVAVPIDIKLTAQDIQQLILHSQSRLILSSKTLYPALQKYLEDIKDLEVLLVDSVEFLNELKSSSSQILRESIPLPEDKVVAMFYTSGTTNVPKAVMLSTKNLLSNAQSIKKINIATVDDVFISFLPLHHTYSFMVTCLLPLLLGAQISYPVGLNSEDLISCMRDTRVSILVGVPQVFLLFQRAIKEKLRKLPFIVKGLLGILIEVSWIIRKYFGLNLSKSLLTKLHENLGKNLRFMITGGARLEPKVICDFFKWGFTFLEGYGLTETSPVATFNPPQKPRTGSVGKPIPGVEIKIVNPDNQGIGEVAIKGPNVMLGYYQLPQETERVIREDWFYSGDLGYLDKEGYLYIVGRKDELLVLSSGKKINPEEIERHYSLSPFIKEICVFAAKTQGFFKEAMQLIAVVVPDTEYFRKRGQVNIEEKIRWELDNLSYKLSDYKRIKSFIISTEGLPRTRLGKIMRHKIEAKYSDRLAAPKKEEEVTGKEDLVLLSYEYCQKVLDYLSSHLKRKVNLGDHLELDLGLDSLARVELLLELQRLLGIQVPESLMTELFYAHTIRDLLQKVRPYILEEIAESKREKFYWAKVLEQPLPFDTLRYMRLKPLILDRVFATFSLIFLQITFRTFFLLRVKGKRNFPKDGPCIIYANHSSYLDGFILASCLPYRLAINCYFLGFREYFLNPLTKNLVKVARLVPLDITFDLVKAMQVCAYLLKQSKIVCFFPEGQRSPTGEVIGFKKGIGILAKELNVPLIPTYIEGAFRAWPRYRWFPIPYKISITIGKKISPSAILSEQVAKGEVYESLAESLRTELIRLKRPS